ncbi:3'-5' exonuclease [Lysinibacillus sphaericus]|uniref:3'-5' exonuclease n=1 Tax=Lysinibacillus sphaericus TaxID=1421 RepID=UPI0018CCFF7E|nr:exonuclease domain-containing protein [Lysinibacillus sphaericus]
MSTSSMANSVVDITNLKENILEIHRTFMEAKHSTYVICDIETTGVAGLDKGTKVIELAALKYVNGKLVSGFHSYVDPECKIPKDIVKLTGITDETVKGNPTIIPVMHQFYHFLGDAIFIAHNAVFDWDRFIKPLFLQAGYKMDNQVICTLKLTRKYFPQLVGHKLNHLADFAGIEMTNHHSGWADCKTLGDIVLEMFKMQFVGEAFDFDISKPLLKANRTPILKDFKIKKVKYWEKTVSKKIERRLYVTMDVGSVFFDYNTNCWNNKDIEQTINFAEIEQRVLRFIRKSNLEEAKAV